MKIINRMLSSALIFLCTIWVGRATPDEYPPRTQSGLQCADWGVHARVVSVYEGEAGRIHCPLFSHPKLYNYSRSQSSGHTLLWYRNRHDQEEPVNRSVHTLLKHRDALWIQPATMEDRGVYICMLGNMTSCVKIGVRLEVFPRQAMCDTTLHRNVAVPMQRNYTFRCPNLKHLPSSTHNVTWYHNCKTEFPDKYFTEVLGDEFVIYQMYHWSAGNYTCVVYYQSNGQTFGYTYTFNVRGVGSGPKQPKILNPDPSQNYPVTVGEKAEFACRAFLPYLDDEEQQVWWSINNKTLDELSDPRYTSPPIRLLLDDYGDQNVERLLYVSPFKAEDLHKEFRCSVHNSEGFNSRVAKLEQVYVPSVELGCGLGVTLGIALLLFVLYRVFWLEVHLLYRSWFGTDERDTDDKEYDVYISYARNTEEEEFVLGTLRHVLEVEFGYTVCIFDRDSLPGGTVTEETLQFVSRSRRLVVILSPCSKFRDGQALLEVRAGVSAMLRGSSIRLVLIQYKTVHKQPSENASKMHACVKELRRARIALAVVRWEGEKSTPLTSHFWKKLRLQLPVRAHAHATKHTHTTEHTPTAKQTRDTNHTIDKQSPEAKALMLESLHTSNTHTQTHLTV